ncbi:hypothetical protein [Pseudomonas phage PIP]|nr:hypothetical protein [Pseudomonas phage PIP]
MRLCSLDVMGQVRRVVGQLSCSSRLGFHRVAVLVLDSPSRATVVSAYTSSVVRSTSAGSIVSFWIWRRTTRASIR